MGYCTRVTGEFQIRPVLAWEEIENSPFEQCRSDREIYEAPGVDLHLIVSEESRPIEGGVAYIRTASRVVMPHIDEYRAYYLLEHVQKVVDMFPGHTFSGRLGCEGDDSADIWRVEIHDGKAVEVKPKILWPDEEAKLYLEERAR